MQCPQQQADMCIQVLVVVLRAVVKIVTGGLISLFGARVRPQPGKTVLSLRGTDLGALAFQKVRVACRCGLGTDFAAADFCLFHSQLHCVFRLSSAVPHGGPVLSVNKPQMENPIDSSCTCCSLSKPMQSNCINVRITTIIHYALYAWSI